MKTGPVTEIIIYVRDMASQVSFYRDVLGLTVSYPADCADYTDEQWVTFATGGCTLALHAGGKEKKNDDLPKVVFQVENVSEARKELAGRGVNFGEPFSPAPGIIVSNGFDPEGNPLALESQE